MSGPAGRELQPSARGRLRAAGRAATDFTDKHFHHDQRLQASRKQNRSRRDRRAAASPRGGPLLLQAGGPRRPRPENELALARQFIFDFSFLIAPAGRSGPQLRPREGPLLASEVRSHGSSQAAARSRRAEKIFFPSGVSFPVFYATFATEKGLRCGQPARNKRESGANPEQYLLL